jgi:hypothetical protein
MEVEAAWRCWERTLGNWRLLVGVISFRLAVNAGLRWLVKMKIIFNAINTFYHQVT